MWKTCRGGSQRSVPFQDHDSGSEDDVANRKPGVKSERWARESPATSWKQGSRERHRSSLVHGLLFLHRLILWPEMEKYDT